MFRQKEQIDKWLDENIRTLLINTKEIDQNDNHFQKCVIVNINQGEQMNKNKNDNNNNNFQTVLKDEKWNREASKRDRINQTSKNNGRRGSLQPRCMNGKKAFFL